LSDAGRNAAGEGGMVALCVIGTSASAGWPPAETGGSILLQPVSLPLAHTVGNVGPGHGPALVPFVDVQACEELRHLGRMKSMSRLEDGRHSLELSLVLELIWLLNVCHRLHPGIGNPGHWRKQEVSQRICLKMRPGMARAALPGGVCAMLAHGVGGVERPMPRSV